MPTYQDQRIAELAAYTALIYQNTVGAIDGTVHQNSGVGVINDYYDNLVAYDGFTYRFVRVDDDNANNAASLQAAYDEAKLLTPGGSALSATNRVAILLPPGTYAFGTGVFAVDTEFIDFVGLSNNPKDVVISSFYDTADGKGTVYKTVDDVAFANLTIYNGANTLVNVDGTDASAFAPQGTYTNELFVNVRFEVEDPSTGLPTRLETNYAGTYTDCWAHPESSYTFQDAPGTFTRVNTGTYAFQAASGIFTDCNASGASFASVSGTLNRCTVSIGGGFTSIGATGKLYDCVGDSGSFGSSAVGARLENCRSLGTGFSAPTGGLGGTYINCSTVGDGFNGLLMDGKFTGCVAGGNGFGLVASAIISGTFTDCSAAGGFGAGAASVLSGTFTNCSVATSGFGSGIGSELSGTFTNCRALDNSFGNATSVLSGKFTECSARDRSFGYGGNSGTISTISGLFYHCTGRDDCFGTNTSITEAARFEHCSARDRSFGQGNSGLSSLGAAGLFRYCSGREACFGAGMFEGAIASGTFEHCSAGDGSFGAGEGAVANGVYINCVGGDLCFGTASSFSVPPEASGLFDNCIGGDYSFGSGSGSSQPEASGTFRNCKGGQYSFGGNTNTAVGGLANGNFYDCDGGLYAFGSGLTGAMTGNMIGCKLTTGGVLGVLEWVGTATGTLNGCQITVTGANNSALLIGNGATVNGCSLFGNGTGYAVTAAGAVTAAITLNRGSQNGINTTNVTNSVPGPENVWGTAQTRRYKATLTQTSTNAPVVTVIANTLGAAPVSSYQDVGFYRLTLAGAFPILKTTAFLQNNTDDGAVNYMFSAKVDASGDFIAISTGTGADVFNDILTNTCLVVEVEP